MSYFVAGILRIVMLEANAALLIIARVLNGLAPGDARAQRRVTIAFQCLAVLALFSWTNYGALRGYDGMVHRWEQYHFFLGSKYLREVGYLDIYKATFLADRESAHVLSRLKLTRDLSNFEEEPIDVALRDSGAVRAAFSDARWQAFVADWNTIAKGNANWSMILADHGNSGSPAWAMVAAPLARLFGVSPTGQVLMGLCDVALMMLLFAFAAATFGPRASSVMLLIWALIPFCFDYLAGSFLRWDWLFALGMCLCFWQRRRPFVAGAFLGYAIASKLFPICFAAALAINVAIRLARTRRFPARWLRFAGGAVVAATLAVVISSAMFGGFSIWRRYDQRIAVANNEKFYPKQYSFRTVFLQFAVSRSDELARGWMAPADVKQARADVELSDHRIGFLAWRLALTALIALALAFTDELEALAVGPLLVYVWLMVNAYYWNMLALPALIWTWRQEAGARGRLAPLIALHLLLGWFYLYQHLNHGFAEGYFVGLLMLGLVLTWSIATIVTGVTGVRAAYKP